jgi:SAM-dependent methyltransferase
MSREQEDKTLFDRIAKKYARKDANDSSALARKSKLISALKPVLDRTRNLGTVVDIGCGAGGPAKYLAGFYEHYIGIDQSEELIKAARDLHRDNPRADFIAANIKAEGLPRQVADVVLSDGALHHMSELDKVMGSLSRIAKPGAFFIAIEPQNTNPVIMGMRWLRGRLDPAYSLEQVFFSPKDLQNLFANAGLSVPVIDYQGFFSTPFAEVVLVPQALFVPFSRLASAVDRWLQVHLPPAVKKISFNIVATGRFPE